MGNAGRGIELNGVIDQFGHLDNAYNYDSSDALPFPAASIARLLGEYRLVAKKAAAQPDETYLAVIIWPPSVWFCPSHNGLDGVFVEPYDQDKHGVGIEISKGENIWSYSNLDAIRDGWGFYSDMLSVSKETQAQILGDRIHLNDKPRLYPTADQMVTQWGKTKQPWWNIYPTQGFLVYAVKRRAPGNRALLTPRVSSAQENFPTFQINRSGRAVKTTAENFPCALPSPGGPID